MDALFAAIGLADAGLFVRAVVAFLICLALLALVFLGLGWVSGRSPLPNARGGRQPRLGVIEETSVDAKRRLVLVRRDNAEHLILTGGPNDLVVEGPILRGPARPQAEAQRRAQARVAGTTQGASADPSRAVAPEADPSAGAPATPRQAGSDSAGAGAALAASKSPSPASAAAASRPSAEPAAENGVPAAAPTVSQAPTPAPEDDPFARARPTRRADAPYAAPRVSGAAQDDPPQDDAPQDNAVQDDAVQDDAALADAFARDFEADLTGEDEPSEGATDAATAQAREASRAFEGPDATEAGQDDEGRPAETLDEAWETRDDADSSDSETFGIPELPEPTRGAEAPSRPTSDPDAGSDAGSDVGLAPPTHRGQVPIDDEPTPALPRFLRGEPGGEPRRGVPSRQSLGGLAVPQKPSDDSDEVVVIEAPRGNVSRPFEALYRARQGTAPTQEPDGEGAEAERVRDVAPTPVPASIGPAPAGPAPSEPEVPESQERETQEREAQERENQVHENQDYETQSPEIDAPDIEGEETQASEPPARRGASDMQSLEEQMENLLRELTERGKPGGGKA